MEARQVAISDKLQVKLEELAAQTLPHLNVVTSSFGRSNTGQINQLAYYDKYVRAMDPELLVLVLHVNDFWDNSPFLQAMTNGYYPEHTPYVTAERNEDGAMRLRPPDPEYFPIPAATPPFSRWQTWLDKMAEVSHFTKWFRIKSKTFYADPGPYHLMLGWMEHLKDHPAYEMLPLEWWPSNLTEAYIYIYIYIYRR